MTEIIKFVLYVQFDLSTHCGHFLLKLTDGQNFRILLYADKSDEHENQILN